MPNPDPPASVMAAASSPDWAARAQAAEQLAPWADRSDIAVILSQLILDTADTAVTDSACTALLNRDDIHGLRIIARAVATASDPEDLDHLYWAVSGHLVPNGPVNEFLTICDTLTHDQDTDTATGAAQLLQWVRPWA